jgi:nucleoside-diphosphate-sugar epimerase
MSGSLIFITGSTGFIGSQVVRVAVAAGYRVRLSIRRPEQTQKVLSRYPEYQSKIETVVIPDLTRAESLKSALENVDFVFHLASPMPGSGSDVRTDFVYPAVQNTEAILQAATEFPQIKKVVIVSSLLALAPVDALIAKSVFVKGRVV